MVQSGDRAERFRGIHDHRHHWDVAQLAVGGGFEHTAAVIVGGAVQHFDHHLVGAVRALLLLLRLLLLRVLLRMMRVLVRMRVLVLRRLRRRRRWRLLLLMLLLLLRCGHRLLRHLIRVHLGHVTVDGRPMARAERAVGTCQVLLAGMRVHVRL